jgi:dTDP-4-dehydrorhamnose reductase
LSVAKIRRILVVGASGYLGSALAQGLREDYEVFGTYYRHPTRLDGVTCAPLNLANGGDILELLKRLKPDVVLYAAGLFDLETCEAQRAEADTANFKSASVFHKLSQDPPRFVYYSMDEVYGMLSRPSEGGFTEKNEPAPTHHLGRTRAQGESSTVMTGRGNVVFRLGRLYGEALRPGAHLAKPPLHASFEKVAAGQAALFAQDLVRSPLYVGDVVRATSLLLKNFGAPGPGRLYNLGGPEALSDHDLGVQFAHAFGFDPALIKAGTLGAARNQRAVRAPLDSGKIAADLGFHAQSARDGLGEWADRLKKGDTRTWAR